MEMTTSHFIDRTRTIYDDYIMVPEEERMLESILKTSSNMHMQCCFGGAALFVSIFREYTNYMDEIDEMIDNEY